MCSIWVVLDPMRPAMRVPFIKWVGQRKQVDWQIRSLPPDGALCSPSVGSTNPVLFGVVTLLDYLYRQTVDWVICLSRNRPPSRAELVVRCGNHQGGQEGTFELASGCPHRLQFLEVKSIEWIDVCIHSGGTSVLPRTVALLCLQLAVRVDYLVRS